MKLRRLLVVCAAAATLPGCGRGPAPREVVYNCAANAADVAALQKEIPDFTAAAGVNIRLNPFSGQDKLYAMMVAGQTPDIFYTNTTMRDRLAAEGRLLDLRTVSAGDSFVSRLWPAVVSNGRSVDGGWYSLDNWSFTIGVYYNREMFEDAGLQAPDSAWTWDTMLSLARKLTRDTDGDGSIDTYGIFIGSHFVEALELMNGAPIRQNALTVEFSPASVEAFGRYIGLMREGVMPDVRRIQAMGMQPAQLLDGGRTAMLVEAVPHQMLIETLRIRWGVAPLPRFTGKTPRYFRSGSGGLSISSTTADPAAAWTALKWIVAGAKIYQPNPVLRDVDFAGGWEQRYPQLVGSGFREVWEQSLRYESTDPRFFVRFSSWTAASILERLQPQLDRLWAGDQSVDDLLSALPGINARVRDDLAELLKRESLRPEFRKQIEQQLSELERER
jgi:multiple sugar transport system substrate-binding protein